MDCSFAVHSGTDLQHTKSRAKPWQHRATKSITTMKWSTEAQKSRKLLSLSFCDGNTEPSKASFTALQQTHKHKKDKMLLYIVKCECFRAHTHTPSDTHIHTHTAECESAMLGVTKAGVLGFWAARAEDTHMRLLRCFLDSQHPEKTHRGVLRKVLQQFQLKTYTMWGREKGRKGVWGDLETGTAANT